MLDVKSKDSKEFPYGSEESLRDTSEWNWVQQGIMIVVE